MNGTEIIVLVGGLVLGYWIVNGFLNRKPIAPVAQNFRRSAPHTPPRRDDVEDGPISSTWFRILEVSEYASREEITRAYKSKMSQYHPDKVMQLGADIRELAEHKSKMINVAYDYAMKRFE